MLYKKLGSTFLIYSFFVSTVYGNQVSDLQLTDSELLLIQKVEYSISNAERGISSLASEILKLEGMSSPKVRHLLNNLCALPGARYLEIGSYKGSTWISALYNNSSTLISSTSIDN